MSTVHHQEYLKTVYTQGSGILTTLADANITNSEQPDTPQRQYNRHKRFARWIPKAKETHSE